MGNDDLEYIQKQIELLRIDNLNVKKELSVDDVDKRLYDIEIEIFKAMDAAVEANKESASDDVEHETLAGVVNNEANFKTLSLLELQLKALREDMPKHLKPYKSSDIDVEMYLMKIKAMQSKVHRVIESIKGSEVAVCKKCSYYEGKTEHDKMYCRDCRQGDRFKAN